MVETVNLSCHGVDINNKPVLDKPEQVLIILCESPDSKTISAIVSDCPHNSGDNGEFCVASGKKIVCPFSFDCPRTFKECGQVIPLILHGAISKFSK